MEKTKLLRVLKIVVLIVINTTALSQELKNIDLGTKPTLRIFVSSSMSKVLLRQYAKEAKQYEGVLVLRGLPRGSIHKLTDLVMAISTDHSAPIQIDDEAFSSFNVTAVPAIVISQASKYDKITGSITIKSALQTFVKSGDLSNEARRLLKCK